MQAFHGDGATMQLSVEANETSVRHQRAIMELEKKKVARQIAVPTNDNQVRAKLREHGEAICLFGETIPDRRERLRELLSRLVTAGESINKAEVDEEDEEEMKELFYTEGIAELKQARIDIANFSLERAAMRLHGAKRRRDEYEFMETEEIKRVMEGATTLGSIASNIGDNRPIAFCRFSPDSSTLATASWSGACRVWDLPACKAGMLLEGHTDRCTSITWHPEASASRDEAAASLISSSADTTARLWTKNGKPLGTLAGHTDRVNRALFHPNGLHVATTSHDGTWRLWDATRQTELLRQDGHSRGVFGFAFQRDGSLCLSTGLEGVVRCWDIRSGKNIHDLIGHVKQTLAVDCAPNGYQVATGSDDRTAKVWDLRKMKCIYTIPAHSALISSVRYQPGGGHYLMTAAYDNKWKIWSTRDYSLIKTNEGHEGSVMCVDASEDGKYFASSSFDRTWKLWEED